MNSMNHTMSARLKCEVAWEVAMLTTWGNDSQSTLKVELVITLFRHPKADGCTRQQHQRKISGRYLFNNIEQAQPIGLLIDTHLFGNDEKFHMCHS